MLVKNRKEPWGQTVSRLLDPEGLLVGVTLHAIHAGSCNLIDRCRARKRKSGTVKLRADARLDQRCLSL
jgi:hypothetical protein